MTEDLYQWCKKYAIEALDEGRRSHRYAWFYLGAEATEDIITGAIYRAILEREKAKNNKRFVECGVCCDIWEDHVC